MESGTYRELREHIYYDINPVVPTKNDNNCYELTLSSEPVQRGL